MLKFPENKCAKQTGYNEVIIQLGNISVHTDLNHNGPLYNLLYSNIIIVFYTRLV
jgi:hypothetical protein